MRSGRSRCVAAYRAEVRDLSAKPLLARSYQRLDVDHLQHNVTGRSLRAEIERAAAQARRRTSDRALPRFTSERHGQRRIVEDPPLITRVNDADADQLASGLDEYLATLAPHWRRALGGYTLVDIAHKVVGVGSVGLRAYVALLEGSSPDDVVFLQLKQARRSVLAHYVHGDSAWHAHQGQRVVEYQQALQTVSDPLLGWTTVGRRQYYVRQFRNMKGTVALDSIDAAALADYAGVVGHLLAKGHARTSGASMIVGYVGVLRQARPRAGPVRPALRRPDRGRSRRPGQGGRPGHRADRAQPMNACCQLRHPRRLRRRRTRVPPRASRPVKSAAPHREHDDHRGHADRHWEVPASVTASATAATQPTTPDRHTSMRTRFLMSVEVFGCVWMPGKTDESNAPIGSMWRDVGRRRLPLGSHE